MKRFTTLALSLCLVAIAASAQIPSTSGNLFAAGPSYNGSFAGTGLYARAIANDTYAFTVFDIVPVTLKPALIVDTQISAGVAPRVATFGTVKVFVPSAAGYSHTGTNSGWDWSTGALASIPIGQSNWRILPNVRLLKSSIGVGYQVIGSVLFGWGN